MSLTLRVQRGNIQSASQDPDQTVSNAGDGLLDQNLTTRNAISIGAAGLYAKRVMQATGGALINQMGNARVNRRLNVAKKGAGYALIGIASGNVALAGIGAAADLGIQVIDGIQEAQEISFANERKVSERGGTTSLGTNYD